MAGDWREGVLLATLGRSRLRQCGFLRLRACWALPSMAARLQLTAGRLKASSHCQGKSWLRFLDHQSSAPQSRQSPARQNQPRDVHHSPLCKQKTGCPSAGNQTAVRRFDPRPRRGSKKRGIRRCTCHRKADFSRATSELGQSSPSFRLSSHAKRRRRHKT